MSADNRWIAKDEYRTQLVALAHPFIPNLIVIAEDYNFTEKQVHELLVIIEDMLLEELAKRNFTP